jgi:cyclopropane fatty-acyl-phospholipid synthase-like methyltransferase
MTDPRTRVVADGYDAIGEAFVAWRDRIVGDPRRAWEEELTSRLPDGARVLELGCGAGVPDTQRLAARFRVTGVDISPRQVERAHAAVPEAEFICADFTALELAPGGFEAVVAFYSFNNVPRDLLPGLFARIHSWLTPGGLFMSALGTSDTEGWVGEWLGAPMFFSSYPPETNARLLREAGFELLRDEVVTFEEPEGPDEAGGPAHFQWILGRR